MNMDLKILNPSKYRIYTLRHVSADLNSLSKLKDEIFEQCEESVPIKLNGSGLFSPFQKIMINNRLDLNDNIIAACSIDGLTTMVTHLPQVRYKQLHHLAGSPVATRPPHAVLG